MALILDKMCSVVKKWQTMVEAHVDVKTADGYLLRLFCVGFTKTRNKQVHKSPVHSITRSTGSWKS
ncbi:40S ribosomal protein S3a [Cricetulus griseus]|uniref:40S ribosomal protein S3a n=1 Tax=Cricetulus griseus TaxID=10029 RepID=G3IMT9_CRIGR|nr:40S ribosomal protein S3a [Cricetulus griseus]